MNAFAPDIKNNKMEKKIYVRYHMMYHIIGFTQLYDYFFCNIYFMRRSLSSTYTFSCLCLAKCCAMNL